VIRLFVVDVNKDSTKSKKPSKDIKNGAIVYLDKVVKSHLRAFPDDQSTTCQNLCFRDFGRMYWACSFFSQRRASHFEVHP